MPGSQHIVHRGSLFLLEWSLQIEPEAKFNSTPCRPTPMKALSHPKRSQRNTFDAKGNKAQIQVASFEMFLLAQMDGAAVWLPDFLSVGVLYRLM